MITPLYANKVFIKIHCYFVIIIFSIPGRKRSFLNLKKGIQPQNLQYILHMHAPNLQLKPVPSQGSFRPHSGLGCAIRHLVTLSK